MESTEPWVFKIDPLILENDGIFLEPDYERSSLIQGDLMDLDVLTIPDTARLHFSVNKKSISALSKFDIYPGAGHVPVVSCRMKEAILRICKREIKFFRATITSRNGESQPCWCVAPLMRRDCIDTASSKVARWWGESRPGVAWEFEEVVLFPNCLTGNHLIRDDTYSTILFISGELKKIITDLNDYGVNFLRANELRET